MHRHPVKLRAAAAMVAVAGATALPASAATAATRHVITFQEPAPRVAALDLPPKSKANAETVSLGDILTVTSPLETAAHKRIGLFGGQCTALGDGALTKTPLLCRAVYRLGGGQIVTEGVMTLGATNLAIVGGSGRYAEARGLVTPGKPAKGFQEADKLTIAY